MLTCEDLVVSENRTWKYWLRTRLFPACFLAIGLLIILFSNMNEQRKIVLFTFLSGALVVSASWQLSIIIDARRMEKYADELQEKGLLEALALIVRVHKQLRKYEKCLDKLLSLKESDRLPEDLKNSFDAFIGECKEKQLELQEKYAQLRSEFVAHLEGGHLPLILPPEVKQEECDQLDESLV